MRHHLTRQYADSLLYSVHRLLCKYRDNTNNYHLASRNDRRTWQNNQTSIHELGKSVVSWKKCGVNWAKTVISRQPYKTDRHTDKRRAIAIPRIQRAVYALLLYRAHQGLCDDARSKTRPTDCGRLWLTYLIIDWLIDWFIYLLICLHTDYLLSK